MHYREIQPSGPASQFVKCYWLLEDDTPALVAQRVVPDGRAELIVNLGTPYVEADEPQPQCFLMGQITGPLMLRAGGPINVIGIRFRPHTAGQLLRAPMNEITDAGAISIADISLPLSRKLEALQEIRSPLAWVSVLDGIFTQAAANCDRMVAGAVRGFEHTVGLIGIDEMARQAGISARQFERRFLQAVGIPPKLFARMQRFQRVFRALDSDAPNWADTAVRCGYYDQAHLIRDFREFAGKPPTALIAENTDLARHFIQPGL